MEAGVWARRVSVVVACIATAVLVGWATHHVALTSFLAGPHVTRPESAIAFLSCAGAVWCLTSPSRAARAAGYGLAGLAGLVALESLASRYGLSPISHALFPRSADGARTLSVPTTLGLALSALALFLSRSPRPDAKIAFDVATRVTILVGMLEVLGSIYGPSDVRTLVPFRHAALPSALCLFGLGTSISFVRADRDFVRALLERGPSGSLLRRLIPVATLLPVFLALVERAAARRGWFEALGQAPFVAIEIVAIVWFVWRSTRWVHRFHAEREAAEDALEEATRSKLALLHENELRFRLLAEAAPQVVWTARPDGSLDYLSPSWSRFTGESSHDAEGWLWEKYVHPEDLTRVGKAWREATERGEPYELEYRAKRGDGAYRWFLSRAIPVRGPEGRIQSWCGADTDVHDLHEAREALAHSEARFHAAFEDREFIVWSQDAELRYTWIYNPVRAYEPTRSIGRTDFDLVEVHEDAENLTALKRRVLETGQPFSGQVPMTLSGKRIYFEMRVMPVFDAHGRIAGLTGTAYDITSRRKSEEAFIHAQKLESIGRLAGGVAHDFNNLLTGTLGSASLALESLPADAPPRLRRLLEAVVESTESAAQLTQQLLAYAGKGRFQVEPTNVRALTESAMALIRASVPDAIRLDFEVPSELPLVTADGSQVQQLVTNLVLNSVEAIGSSRGRIVIALRSIALTPEAARTFDVESSGDADYVQIEVRDDGPGMQEETLRRAFEPFFSTKFVGRGLGLAAAQGIARAHGGGIVARSEPGEGATLVVTLPALRDAGREAPAASPSGAVASRPPEGGVGVLVVDDDPHVRELAELALTAAGYRVWGAANGVEALDVAREQGDAIDVVVLDMTMPVMGGVETARRLRSERADLPIVASSGYSEAETLGRFGDVASIFLRKPYRPAELVAKVATAIELGRAKRD